MNVKFIRVKFLNENKNNAENVEASWYGAAVKFGIKIELQFSKKRSYSIILWDAGNGGIS